MNKFCFIFRFNDYEIYVVKGCFVWLDFIEYICLKYIDKVKNFGKNFNIYFELNYWLVYEIMVKDYFLIV